MIFLHRPIRRVRLALLCTLLASEDAMAQARQPIDTSADNLMVVLRESMGENKTDETLRPQGKLKTKLDSGKEVEFELAAFEFIGDMHIRFVFDGPQTMAIAKPEDLSRLHLSPTEALRVAVANIKRVYGAPQVTPWTAGLMQVQGKSPDLDSSYFLDREFWLALSKLHPDGLVVSVAKRGGLVFTPVTDSDAVDRLRRGVAYLHTSSGRMRISSGLYLFKDDRWSVFQSPQPQ